MPGPIAFHFIAAVPYNARRVFRSDSRRGDLIAILLLLLVGTLFFAHVLFLGRSLYLRDLTRFYYPTKGLVRDLMLSGEFPHWNPYFSAGQPLAANPEYELFYPPQWLILLPSYDFGYRLHIIFHVYAALIGMYLLLRSMSLRRKSAFFGAISFGVGGLFLSFVNLLPIMFCATWMPFIFLFARRALMQRRVGDVALAGLFGGLQILTAEPTTLIQTWFMVGLYALYRAWYSQKRIRVAAANLAVVGTIVILATLTGAVQFIPALDHVGDSVRSRAFDYSLVTTWSMPFAKPLELLYPNVFGHMSRKNVTWYWGGGMYPNTGSPFIYNIYCGFVLTVLVLGAVFIKPRGGRLVLLIVSASVLLALGGHTPLFKALYAMGVGSIRYPEKFALMGVVALIIFGSHLLDRLLDGDQKLTAAAIGVSSAATLFALVICIFSVTPWYIPAFSHLWGAKEPQASFMAAVHRIDWWIAFARCLLVTALLLWARERKPPSAWFVAVCGLTLVDLGFLSVELNPTLPRGFFTPPPITRTFDAQKDSYRLFHEADWYNQTDTAKKYFSTGNAVYWVVRNGLFPMTPQSWRFRTVLERDYDKTALLSTVELVDAMWQVKNRGRKDWAQIFMAMSNGRYHGQYAPFEEEKKRTGGRFKSSTPIRFTDHGNNPRYYFAGQLEQVRSKKEFVDKLVKKNWSRHVAFVEFLPFRAAVGDIRSVRESNNSIALDVETKGRGFLVASVTRHKYWRAFIDGAPASIHTVNIGYQGVIVESGKHSVRFVYRNPVVMGSLWVTLGSIGFLAVVLVGWRGAVFSKPPEALAGPENVHKHASGIADDPHPGIDRVEPFHRNLGD